MCMGIPVTEAVREAWGSSVLDTPMLPTRKAANRIDRIADRSPWYGGGRSLAAGDRIQSHPAANEGPEWP